MQNIQIEWLESMHTLHGAVEILYVVDGFQIQRTFNSSDVGDPSKAETLIQAIDMAIAEGWEPLTMANIKNYEW